MARTNSTQNSDHLEIWQWNCRTFHKRAAALQNYIHSALIPPDVICLQEVGNRPVKLQGYYTLYDPKYPRVAALVSNFMTVALDHYDQTDINHQIIDVFPQKRGKVRTKILNIYSPPKNRNDDFGPLLNEAVRAVGTRDQLVVVGDFNAPSTAWGYVRDSPKGVLLENTTSKLGFTLITLPTAPTRLGNSISRDTYPDLTFTFNIKNATWSNLDENLGSDHYILSTSIASPKVRRVAGDVVMTDWVTFRKRPLPEQTPCDVSGWVAFIRETHDATSKKIARTVEAPAIDRHLLHMWDSRRRLIKRWKKQRLNRCLYRRIAALSEEANEYATKLATDGWVQFCGSLRGTLGTSQTWAILRSMLEPDKSKSSMNRILQRIVHSYPGTDGELIQALKDRYIGTDVVPPCTLEYIGSENATLDAAITKEEVFAAAQAANRNSAPGSDGITNAMIRNLSTEVLEQITQFLNDHCWSQGHVPPEWKEAKIITIPKPGKAPSLGALRPISLTSCMGKLYERVVQTRLQNYIEKENLFPATMIGFRSGLSTQDAFLLLKEEVMSCVPRGGEHLVLALDLKGAFDNVSHEAILSELNTIGCGKRTFNYIKSFLSGRTATIGIGDTRSVPFSMPNKGTPQGAVISPLLFNIAMRRLAHELEAIPHLGYTLYADDITLWATKGSLALKEQTLQAAATAVAEFARNSGLSCAPEKSELIRIHSKYYKSNGDINLQVDGHAIAEVTQARILGFWVQSNGKASHTITTLKTTVKQIARMIRRITYHKKGMKEKDTLRLVQALVLSRVTYGLPYHSLDRSEESQVDVLIRSAFKAALGLPTSTPTERLLALGIHNTYAELSAAVLMSQRNRLSETSAGRAILTRIGISPHPQHIDEELVDVAQEVRRRISIAPVPKNMHHDFHAERRTARVNWLRKQFGSASNVAYVDAASFDWQRHIITVVDNNMTLLTSASVRTTSATKAETMAIALALRFQERRGEPSVILSDSQEACRLFLRGRLPAMGLRLLGSKLTHHHRLIWCPGHAGLEGNERADALARAFCNRAENPSLSLTMPILPREILAHQRFTRQKCGTPHRSLNGEEATDLRKIQTDVFPHLLKLHAIHPTLYPAVCPWCGGRPTLYHISWGCDRKPSDITNFLGEPLTPSMEQWEAHLASSDPGVQLALLDQVRRAAKASGALDVGPQP